MLFFDRFLTPGLQKRIAVFRRQEDGSYTHETYTSLTQMPEAERIAYLQSCGLNNIMDDVISARRDYVKRVAKTNYDNQFLR